MSWVLNFIRIGALTLFVHDIVDPYLAVSIFNLLFPPPQSFVLGHKKKT